MYFFAVRQPFDLVGLADGDLVGEDGEQRLGAGGCCEDGDESAGELHCR